jgi:hypothetical protein
VKKWYVEGIPGVWVWSGIPWRRRRGKSLARDETESIAPDY